MKPASEAIALFVLLFGVLLAGCDGDWDTGRWLAMPWINVTGAAMIAVAGLLLSKAES